MTSSRLFVLLTVACALESTISCVGDEPSSGGDDTSDGGSTDGTASGDGTVGSDGSTSDSGPGSDSGTPTFCETQSIPDGAADFFCADFDETDFARGFLDASDNITDGSTIGPTNTVFVSSPQSLVTNMAAQSDFQSAYYEWTQAGGKAIQRVAVTTSVNPTGLPLMGGSPGFVFILGIDEGHGGVDFGYSHGADLPDASSYDGYVLRVHAINGGLGFSNEIPAGNITSDVWTSVTLTYDVTTGAVTVSYDGTLAASATQGYLIQSDTVADVLLGGRTFDTTRAGTWRFDNFEITTARAP